MTNFDNAKQMINKMRATAMDYRLRAEYLQNNAHALGEEIRLAEIHEANIEKFLSGSYDLETEDAYDFMESEYEEEEEEESEYEEDEEDEGEEEDEEEY